MLAELLGDDEAAMRDHPLFRLLRERGLVAQGAAPAAVAPAPANEPGPGRAVFRVDGMWCPSCAWVIERTIERLPGVQSASASFAADRVTVEYEPRLIGPERLAAAVSALGWPAAEIGDAAAQKAELRREFLRLIISWILACNVMMLSFGLYAGFFVGGPGEIAGPVGLPLFLLSTIVLTYGGAPIFVRAWQAARRRGFVMETLIALGSLAAYGLGVFNWRRGDPHQYFDTASMLVALVLLGKYLERRIRAGAVAGIDEIYDLLPRKARREQNGRTTWVAIEALAPGDVVRVQGGEAIPADGRVLAGEGAADESRLTGESAPRAKHPGDEALGGSALVTGDLTLAVVAAGSASSLGRMAALVEQALAAKNPAERLADRLIAWFVPAIVALAAVTAALLLARGASLNDALTRAVTVLAIACPCALGVAAPLAKAAAVSRGRRLGLLVTDPDALAAAAELSALVLDKTGVATCGEYAVLGVDAREADAAEILTLAAAAEGDAPHLIARAVRAAAVERGLPRPVAEHVEIALGQGVRGLVNRRWVTVGGENFLHDAGQPIPDAWRAAASAATRQGASVVFVGWDGAARGMIQLGDRPRAGLREAVAELTRRGVEVHLASGDAPATTAQVAAELGIERFQGGLLPADKVALVQRLREQGRRVGMVGDGANDAAALAAADVGFATGDALSVAKHASDVVLLAFSGPRLLDALRLAKTTARAVRVNLALAFVYNLVALPLAVTGMVNPIVAATAMLLSSLTVAANSARIARG
jgi:Cu2+-exporting ATPase/Cu+-exporting ATPase